MIEGKPPLILLVPRYLRRPGVNHQHQLAYVTHTRPKTFVTIIQRSDIHVKPIYFSALPWEDLTPHCSLEFAVLLFCYWYNTMDWCAQFTSAVTYEMNARNQRGGMMSVGIVTCFEMPSRSFCETQSNDPLFIHLLLARLHLLFFEPSSRCWKGGCNGWRCGWYIDSILFVLFVGCWNDTTSRPRSILNPTSLKYLYLQMSRCTIPAVVCTGNQMCMM